MGWTGDFTPSWRVGQTFLSGHEVALQKAGRPDKNVWPTQVGWRRNSRPSRCILLRRDPRVREGERVNVGDVFPLKRHVDGRASLATGRKHRRSHDHEHR